MQAQMPSWALYIDLNGDQAFGYSDSIDLDDVISIDCDLGLDPYQMLARSARATIILNNDTGKYSPENANALAGFTINKAVRLVASDVQFVQFSNGSPLYDANGGYQLDGIYHTVNLFTLKIASIEPDPGQYKRRRTIVKCEDNLNRARNYPVTIATQLNQRADQLITTILSSSTLYPPAAVLWLLGISGHDELGLTTYLNDAAAGAVLDTGDMTFAYAFDNNADSASLYDALRYIVENERGRLFCNRDGNWEFWRRKRLWTDVTIDYVLNDRMVGLDYAYGDEIANVITAHFNPRTLTTGTPTLGTIDSAFKIPSGASRSVDVRFVDSNGNRISTTSAITPVPTTDYTANSLEGGGGTDYTASVSVSMAAYSQSARLTFTNAAAVDVWIQVGSKVRGNNKLTDFGEQELTVEDSTSIGLYDRWPLNLDLRLIDNADDAYDAAQLALYERKNPRGVARGIDIVPLLDDAFLTLALNAPMGQRVRAIETQTGHDDEYFIIGERHSIRGGAASSWDTTLVVEPAPPAAWLLGVTGYDELGLATILL